jgi:S1-C subfamily serine protease
MTLGGTVMRELGVITRPLTEEEARSIRAAEGMVVLDTINPGRAQEAGVQQLDVILSIDGEPVRSVEDLKRFFTGEHGEDEHTLFLYRGGMRGTLTVP